MNRNKKILIIIITIFMFFSLSSCKKESVESIKKEVYEKLNWGSTYSSLDINVVGKYGKGYYIDIGNNDFYRHAQFTIDGIEIPMYNFADSHFYFVDEKLYSPEAAYSLGYLVKEDLYSIRERYLEHNRKIDIDYPLIDPNPQLERCIHKTDGWKITKTATCVEAGKKILLCKKCDKELESVDIYREPHNYVNGKCTYCKDKEYTYTDTYKEAPENMVTFLGGFLYVNDSVKKLDLDNVYKSETYVFLENIEDIDSTNYSIMPIEIEDIVFVLAPSIRIKVYSYTKINNNMTSELYLDEAYEKGIVNKNILLKIQENLNKENIVGKYIYENYDSKIVRTNYPRNTYLKIGEFLQNKLDSKHSYINLVKMLCPTFGSNVDFYGKYNGYYVGMVADRYNHNPVEKTIKLEGYEFEQKSYSKIYVFNDDKIYGLKTAYQKGIINKENLVEIYEIYKIKSLSY